MKSLALDWNEQFLHLGMLWYVCLKWQESCLQWGGTVIDMAAALEIFTMESARVGDWRLRGTVFLFAQSPWAVVCGEQFLILAASIICRVLKMATEWVLVYASTPVIDIAAEICRTESMRRHGRPRGTMSSWSHWVPIWHEQFLHLCMIGLNLAIPLCWKWHGIWCMHPQWSYI